MKSQLRKILLAHLLFALFVPTAVLGNPSTADLNKLYVAKQYFDLRDALRSYADPRNVELLFYSGVVHNKFNRPDLSIKFLNSYLSQNESRQNTPKRIACYELLADNYRKSYQYRKAADVYKTLLTRFRTTVKASEIQDYENSAELWSALADVPPQTTTFKADSFVIQDKDDQLPLEINGQRIALFFDSGANLSVVTSSLAQRLGLQIKEASIDVVAVAGNKVKAKLAVAKEIRLGNISIRNSVFLVFSDADLFVSEANFQINGLIGFPVIESLNEITFVRGKGISVPAKASKGGEQNMVLDGLNPVVAGWYKGDRLSFSFDTGATTTILYPPFFKRYEADVKSTYETHTERVRGVGGHKEIEGYLGKDLVISISGKPGHFKQVAILTQPTNASSDYLYGNLGQDLIQQFEKTTMNFKAMSLVFN
ncbi:MAG TPA: pepsin/retropepsin-like aspartic protease family protein [Pyrinomonadaceae bacterium]|nr:pepsin/retropepsin-like aspartic protease family protein [Pyrinomonadaceae bacterium]